MTDHTLIAPRRPVRTYELNGREVYADTGRPVDERLGSHVVLWIVDDAEAWAAAIEAGADAEVTRWSKSKPNRDLAECQRAQRYQSAAQIRAEGPGRTIRGHYHSAETAEQSVRELRRSHPNPGVRYEVAAITDTDACPDCRQPRIHADGQCRHHSLRYPVGCAQRPEPESEEERVPGEWEIDIGMGSMTCGYCDEKVTWPHALAGAARLTGYHMLGIHRPTGNLVVLAEATTPSGHTIGVPHHCHKIPDHLHATYAKK